jgi:hypothetical protein
MANRVGIHHEIVEILQNWGEPEVLAELLGRSPRTGPRGAAGNHQHECQAFSRGL